MAMVRHPSEEDRVMNKSRTGALSAYHTAILPEVGAIKKMNCAHINTRRSRSFPLF